jgi:hypothetical protein
MNWKIEDVVNALQNENYPKLDNEKELALQLFDPIITCGVGIDNLGRRVLVLPGQELASSFLTKNAEFDPWSSVKWIDSDQILPQVSTLRCEANFKNKSICEAIAVIFTGLINIQLKYGSAGSAIWEMKQLFENGFNSNVSDEVVTGLFGELVLIGSTHNPNVLIEHWHSNIDAYFDFSSEKQRIEVKTSRSNLRNHKFSSNQIGTELDQKTFIVSIILSLVEKGTSLSDLVNEISDKVTTENSIKLVNIVVGTLGTMPEMINEFKIDLIETIKSVRYIKASNIPRPQKSAGVISMNWISNLNDTNHETVDVSSLLK